MDRVFLNYNKVSKLIADGTQNDLLLIKLILMSYF